MQIARVWIAEIVCLVKDDIDTARVARRNPWHLGRARTRADLERTVKVLAAIVRGSKPDRVLIGAGIIHCPDGIDIAGRVDIAAGEIICRIGAISRAASRRCGVGGRIDYTLENWIVCERSGRNSRTGCSGADCHPDVG